MHRYCLNIPIFSSCFLMCFKDDAFLDRRACNITSYTNYIMVGCAILHGHVCQILYIPVILTMYHPSQYLHIYYIIICCPLGNMGFSLNLEGLALGHQLVHLGIPQHKGPLCCHLENAQHLLWFCVYAKCGWNWVTNFVASQSMSQFHKRPLFKGKNYPQPVRSKQHVNTS